VPQQSLFIQWSIIKRDNFFRTTHTTKKLSCPSVFCLALLKITVINKPIPALFETTSIGNPITATQNWRFTNHCNRRPIATVIKNVGIRSPIALE